MFLATDLQIPEILTPTSLAGFLRVSDRHLTNVRAQDDTFPEPRMLETTPRWTAASIHAWVEAVLGGPDPAARAGSRRFWTPSTWPSTWIYPSATSTTCARTTPLPCTADAWEARPLA
jgi:hypothetical protein